MQTCTYITYNYEPNTLKYMHLFKVNSVDSNNNNSLWKYNYVAPLTLFTSTFVVVVVSCTAHGEDKGCSQGERGFRLSEDLLELSLIPAATVHHDP